MTEVLLEAVNEIDNAIKQGRKVLVHCAGGVNRSPTIVIAYMMKANDLSASQAYELVSLARSKMKTKAWPQWSFKQQLISFENFLRRGGKDCEHDVSTCSCYEHFGLPYTWRKASHDIYVKSNGHVVYTSSGITVTTHDITRAFRKASVRHHADKGGTDEAFVMMQMCKEILLESYLHRVYRDALETMSAEKANEFVLGLARMRKEERRRFAEADKDGVVAAFTDVSCSMKQNVVYDGQSRLEYMITMIRSMDERFKEQQTTFFKVTNRGKPLDEIKREFDTCDLNCIVEWLRQDIGCGTYLWEFIMERIFDSFYLARKITEIVIFSDGYDFLSKPPFNGPNGWKPLVADLKDKYDITINFIVLGDDMKKEDVIALESIAWSKGGFFKHVSALSPPDIKAIATEVIAPFTMRHSMRLAIQEARKTEYIGLLASGDSSVVPV